MHTTHFKYPPPLQFASGFRRLCVFLPPLVVGQPKPIIHPSNSILFCCQRPPPVFLFLSCNVIYLSIYLSVITLVAPFHIHIYISFFSMFFDCGHGSSFLSCLLSFCFHVYPDFYTFFCFFFYAVKRNLVMKFSFSHVLSDFFLSFLFLAGFGWALCRVVLAQLWSDFFFPPFFLCPSFLLLKIVTYQRNVSLCHRKLSNLPMMYIYLPHNELHLHDIFVALSLSDFAKVLTWAEKRGSHSNFPDILRRFPWIYLHRIANQNAEGQLFCEFLMLICGFTTLM